MIAFLLPLPMAFRYELAHAVEINEQTKAKTYVDWRLHLDWKAPNAGDDAQRNIKPLYGLQASKFAMGDVVHKRSGARWSGKVCGFYSTSNTPIGYAVESLAPDTLGSVQIYPESALELGEYDN